MPWFKNKSFALTTGYCLEVSNSTKAQEKNQEAIKSTQLQQCSTHMPVIWVKTIVGTDIIKIPQGFNFFVKTDLMISWAKQMYLLIKSTDIQDKICPNIRKWWNFKTI